MAGIPPVIPVVGGAIVPPPPAPYVPVQGAVAAAAALTEDETIQQVLYWIGFRDDVQRTAIIDDSLGSYQDILMLSEKDITAMAEEWHRRSANGRPRRIIFGIRRTKLLKGITHWVADFYRVSDIPHVDNLNEDAFKSQILRALARNEVRRQMRDDTKTAADAASPGPLESEKKWKQWEEKFVNYTHCHLGTNGIPLSYIIRENDAPALTGGPFPDFISQTVACAPLTGEYYEADKRAVFNMLVSFTTGQPSGDWIKDTLRYHDGRRSMQALRNHFAGEGNATRNMAEADRLKESLHYKSERSMAFETFLTNCQKMFNIYDNEGEPMADDAKTRFLFKKVQHSGLQAAIAALRAQQTAGTNITYTMAANHLSTAVSELPEYISKNRNVSGVGTGSDQKGSADIYNSDGSIITGHIPNWRNLTKFDRDLVMNERKRLGIRGGKNSSSGGGNGNKSDANRIKQITAQNKKLKRQIKAIKRKQSSDDATAVTVNSDTDVDPGDTFGGRNSKKKSKNT